MQDSKTIIVFNGGQSVPDQKEWLSQLKNLLRTQALDPAFEQKGSFFTHVQFLTIPPMGDGKFYYFQGQFSGMSFGFSLFSQDVVLVRELTSLISQNMRSPSYLLLKAELAELRAFWPEVSEAQVKHLSAVEAMGKLAIAKAHQQVETRH